MIRDALRRAAARFAAAGIDTPALDARLLLMHVSGLPREALVAEPEAVLPPEVMARYEALVSARASRQPVAQLTGMREFWGMEFTVTPDVLTPRPETETLVEAVLRRVPDREAPMRILDLGTGTGCLLLSLLSELPGARGLGVDASPAALAVAKANAEALRLSARSHFRLSEWCKEVVGTFEIIVANPPYIPSNAIGALMPEVAAYEPRMSLDGGMDGLACYRNIAAELPFHASKGAWIVLEVGEGQHEAVADIFMQAGFRLKAVEPDLSGVMRCVTLQSL